MKKIIPCILLIITVCLIACKKNDVEPAFTSYLRFNLEAVPTACNTRINASYLPPAIGPDKIITLSGTWANGSIEFYLNEAEVLKAGNYPLQADKWRIFTLYSSDPNGRTYTAGASGGIVFGSGSITITEISAEYVKGNFEFITGIDGATNTFKTVTNGDFHIKRG